jgi:hypothetical protein
MRLTILIHRQTRHEPSEGTLKAWVVQEGQRGPQLLTGRVTHVESAQMIIAKRLQADAPGCRIEWTIEDYRAEQETETINREPL